jgi:hypothetical protein
VRNVTEWAHVRFVFSLDPIVVNVYCHFKAEGYISICHTTPHTHTFLIFFCCSCCFRRKRKIAACIIFQSFSFLGSREPQNRHGHPFAYHTQRERAELTYFDVCEFITFIMIPFLLPSSRDKMKMQKKTEFHVH